jgi:demethylmenaquinone methyltransferase/2-methoxy-6-polyprenyl-1,4-benzoquinol methylase
MSRPPSDAEVAAYFDRCASNGAMGEFEAPELEVVERLLGEWRIGPGDRVLEPGCGSGRLTALLAARVGSEGLVLGLDLSRGMLERARRRGLSRQVRFELGSAAAVPAPDRHFHHVICFNVFPHVLEPAPVLTELHRVMALGASLWIAHLASREAVNTFHRGLEAPVSDHRLPPPHELERLLVAAGFELALLVDGEDGFRARASLARPLARGKDRAGPRSTEAC